MKKYLFVAVALGTVVASAEINPFDLQKNLQKIDRDQEVLLSALQEMADNKDEFADDESTTAPEVEQSVAKEALPQEKENIPSKDVISTQTKKDESVNEPSNQELMNRLRVEGAAEETSKNDAAKQAALEEERIKKVKEAQAKIEETRARQKKEEAIRAEAARAQKAEEERREVEAYEAQRLAKKMEAERLAQKEKQEALEKEKAKKEEQRKIEAAKEAKAKRNAIVDINITKEEMLAKEKADQAYLEAVKEMD